MNSYDMESGAAFGLADLAEGSERESEELYAHNGEPVKANGRISKSFGR